MIWFPIGFIQGMIWASKALRQINTLYALFLLERQRTVSMHRHMINIARLRLGLDKLHQKGLA
jgi:hypothetical protein